jgi:type IV secretory pathway VirB10-like protein
VTVERLIESTGPFTEAEAELAELVEACEPIVISEASKRRSLSAVYGRHHERRRSVRFGLRAATAACLLLVTGAATAAVFGVRWKLPAPRPAATAPAPVVHVARARPRAELAPIAELELPAEPEAEPQIAPPPPPVHRARAGKSEEKSEETSKERFKETSKERFKERSKEKSEDPSLVVSAIQALRQDHDPERAGRLLAAYLRTHPRGALAEEAVALSIEAADGRHNPAATTFASRYLKEYPNGRFRAVAERVLARPAR